MNLHNTPPQDLDLLLAYMRHFPAYGTWEWEPFGDTVRYRRSADLQWQILTTNERVRYTREAKRWSPDRA